MKLTNCSIRQFAVLASLLALAGCQAPPARVELQRVNVPVPVACDEPVPERPVMTTEQLRPGATVDQFTQAALAEIERREAYEIKLAAALANCRRPVSPSLPAAGTITESHP
ncbi:hypothetical protein [Delftia tsuruhatensis]|uniref:hypothetical protein n=1 Tax=Delftia tsuruhatensis TaxID=180282 RepID=UPI0028A9739A|nr:hypothetical protein [Delftia tsuruhatensis]